MTTARRLIFVQLNEVNFDVVRRYLDTEELPALRRLVSGYRAIETFAESAYSELEPWIQWVSAQTGKTYREHGVFRLGDIVNTELPQVFEALEAQGLRVGAISPMNARNSLKQPAYFIPDPWTDTASDGSPFSVRLTEMLRQTVNDNAQQRISARSKRTIAEAVLRTFDPVRTWRLLSTIVASRGRPWLKALVLDQLVHLLHRKLWQAAAPDVSFVFLNAGAHIQHHYFFNSRHAGSTLANPAWYVARDVDPVLDMLRVYDRILADYVAMADQGVRLIVATGLTQVPYDRVKYYWRLADHRRFLELAGIRAAKVLPRMTRDFEVSFDSAADVPAAAAVLQSMVLERSGEPLFAEVEQRGASIFATLTYPDEIQPDDAAVFAGGRIDGFGRMVAFVAIKNGMHSTKGFAFLSPETPATMPSKPVHVSALFDLTLGAVR